MAKTKISILLIKDSIVRREDIIKEDVLTLDLSNGNVLYYRTMPEREPKWVANFFGDGIPEYIREGNSLKGKSVSAVILYTVHIDRENGERTFAVCFGHGRSLLRPNVFERRFGLLVTLNAIEPNQLRSIDVNKLDSTPLKSRVQSSSLASLENFNIDIEKDLLKSIAGMSTIDGMNGLISGTDSLSLTTEEKYDNMDVVLRHCYELYKSDNYKDNFEWVDKIQAISDKELINNLDATMLEKLNDDNPDKVWFSIPEIVDWDASDNFMLKTDNLYIDVDINILKGEYGANFVSINKLKNIYVKCVNSNGDTLRRWPVYRCIYSEISLDDQQYLLNDGKWFKVDSQFAESINQSYNSINVSQLDLPDFTGNEGDYNEKIAATPKYKCFLMDKKLIMYDGGKIEFCDLYSSQGELIHVKKYNGSSVLSHLFMQGLVSAECFRYEDFRSLVNQKMDNDFSVPIEPQEFSPSNYEVVYVIAKKDVVENERPEIPFFSKVTLSNAVKQLKRLNYRVSIKGVRLNQVQQ